MKALRLNWPLLIKLLVSVGFIVMLFSRWADAASVWEGITSLIKKDISLLILACLLIAVNWGLEALKWRVLLQKIYPASLLTSFKFVLTGVTIGFITPGRSGEFAGRMILMPEKIRLESILLTIIGGIAQIIPTILAVIIFSVNGSIKVFSHEIDSLVLASALLLNLVAFIFFKRMIKIPFIIALLKKITINHEILPTSASMTKVLMLSFLRYGVYVLQYALVLHLAGFPILQSIEPVTWMLLLQSFSPAVSFLDIGVRGSIAVWVFSQFAAFNMVVISAVFLLWFINLCLPALAGYLLILNWKRK